eukprot:CAMPEP_0197313990 /NCGR_PEP_ID=MMETSP0891-20130614/31509_1 /TAXON_ID=44058 ORGANISM="Aureoumbra lagunensis, Strain CCMP1510" /NCGR_SAMPLE_ID=MMETSP0891 /ASSEMBLY_ACC=CAM_ASM_000534 /LENGTH=398 /DNA_ID=CAMNT_0042802209 /DNA_START=12 /DNA_END=1208 /DNA_ORIENTATION=+
MRQYEIVIIGGGMMGTSVGLQLALANRRALIIERDASGQSSSASYSAGGIRQQFSLEENVALSVYGAEWLRNGLREAVGTEAFVDPIFRENGYLTLGTDRQSLKSAQQIQRKAGARGIDFLESKALTTKFPWLRTDDLAGGNFGRCDEGYFDPNALLVSTRNGAIRLGTDFVEGTCINLKFDQDKKRVLYCELSDGTRVEAEYFVLTAGAASRKLLDLEVIPKKRSVFVVDCNDSNSPPPNTPLVIDPSGVYFRADNHQGRFVCGVSPPSSFDDPDIDDPHNFEQWREQPDFALFEQVIWPAMAHRVPAFESLKLLHAWSGLYEIHLLDHNALIGPHPDFSNLILATGFSGHGLQHSPGVGRAIAELITTGSYQTINLNRLGVHRIRNRQPLRELAIY